MNNQSRSGNPVDPPSSTSVRYNIIVRTLGPAIEEEEEEEEEEKYGEFGRSLSGLEKKRVDTATY